MKVLSEMNTSIVHFIILNAGSVMPCLGSLGAVQRKMTKMVQGLRNLSDKDKSVSISTP